jgi:hypothetical protein
VVLEVEIAGVIMKLVVVDALITMSRSSHNLGMLTVIILLVTRLIVKDCGEIRERSC